MAGEPYFERGELEAAVDLAHNIFGGAHHDNSLIDAASR